MIQIKKTILTLVALLAVTTGAWAEELSESFTTTNRVLVYTGEHFKITVDHKGDGSGFVLSQAPSRNATIEALNGETITKVEFTKGWYDITRFSCEVGTTTFSGDVATVSGVNQTSLSVTATDPLQIKAVKVYYTEGSSASTVEVDWPKASKTGTFTMPGGNVELEPEYYPQAALTAKPTAINDVPATTDGAIVNVGTVANIGETTTAQGTVMYYAVQSATAPTAPDYDATGWTDKVPTATDFAEGNVYVWYYVKGAEPASVADRTDANTCSDSEITALGTTGYVTLLAAPKYNAEFAFDEGTPDAEKAKWGTNIPDGGVVKGETVTVTYSGSKKVLGVKAEKKAAAPATVLSGALVDGAIIKVNFKWEDMNMGDYVQGVYNAASGTFTASKGGGYWAPYSSAVYKVEKSGDNIIIGAGYFSYDNEGMVWTFNTTNDTYTTTKSGAANEWPEDFAIISVTLNGTDITSQLTAQ